MVDTYTIATWNVNSIKSRLQHLIQYAKESPVDVLLLQELKCVDEAFPTMEIEELGYNVATHGQKTYNGVAILSKFPIDDVERGLPGNALDEQARYIEATLSLPGSAIRVASAYVPNGQEVGSEKFQYKMNFYEHLYTYLKDRVADDAYVLGGDFNVAPQPIDVYDADKLDGTVCYHPDERAHLHSLLHLGYYDAFRLLNPEKQQFSWWDYRGGSYQQNKGLRIDHILTSPLASDRLVKSWIDETPRTWEKPSDHTPVMAEFKVV